MARVLTETVYLESAPTVDAEAGVLKGVKVLGFKSRNGRDYTPAAESAAPKYEGKKIYVNHQRHAERGDDRPFQDWVGVLRNPRKGSDGIYADAYLRKESTYFKGIVEAAEKFPKEVGFSHVAEGESHTEGNTEIVESIKEVFSVDLVTDPATTSGFFESHNGKKKVAIAKLIESLPAETPTEKANKKFFEDMGSMFGPDATAEISESDSILAALKDALKQAMDAVVSLAKAGKEAMPQNNANGNANQNGSGNANGDASANANANANMSGQQIAGKSDQPSQQPEGESDNPLQKKVESLEKRLAFSDAKNELIEASIDPTEIRVRTLAATTDVEQRKLLKESWPSQGKSQSSDTENDGWVESFFGRPSPPKNDAGGSGATSDPKYAEKFAESAKRAKDSLRKSA